MALFEFAEIPKISVLSTTFVRCTVSTTEFGIPSDPTTGTVSFAFLPGDEDVNPESGDWHAGTWETAGGVYYGRCFIGPDGGVVELPADTYDVWVRVATGVETIIERVGKLKIY